MAKNTLFTGTGVALITPFRKQETIDFSKLEELIDYVITSGVDYIVALGTTSEAATMSESERTALLQFIVETVNGRLPIMLGMGGNNTRAVTDAINQTNFDGISGILSVTPYYNKPQQRGLIQHYKNIADVSPVPIVLYNVPGRTSCNMLAETTLQLAEECPNIIAIKEASGNIAQIKDLIARANSKLKIKNYELPFLVISGDDGIACEVMEAGGAGLISVASNAFPKDFWHIVHDKDASLQAKYEEMVQLLFAEGNPVGIKAVLAERGVIGNYLRLPLVPASHSLQQKIANLQAE